MKLGIYNSCALKLFPLGLKSNGEVSPWMRGRENFQNFRKYPILIKLDLWDPWDFCFRASDQTIRDRMMKFGRHAYILYSMQWPRYTDFWYSVFKVIDWHWKFSEGVPLTTKKFIAPKLSWIFKNKIGVTWVAKGRIYFPWKFQGRRMKIVGANFIPATDLQFRLLTNLRGLSQILSNYTVNIEKKEKMLLSEFMEKKEPIHFW